MNSRNAPVAFELPDTALVLLSRLTCNCFSDRFEKLLKIDDLVRRFEELPERDRAVALVFIAQHGSPSQQKRAQALQT